MNLARLYAIIRRPLLTEKTTLLKDRDQYSFEVLLNAKKSEIKAAVEKIFKVKVLSVNIARMSGKSTSFKGVISKKSDWKKAYVRLAEGETIELASTEA